MTSESKNRPYAKPPTSVAVFAHVAENGRNEFVPAGMLEYLDLGGDATFTYGTKYVSARPPATTCSCLTGTNDAIDPTNPIGLG